MRKVNKYKEKKQDGETNVRLAKKARNRQIQEKISRKA